MIKAIIFDFGGVLQEETTAAIAQGIAERFGCNVDDVQKLTEEEVPDFLTGKIDSREFCHRMVSKLGLSVPAEDFQTVWEELYGSNARAYEETEQLVLQLKGAGYKVAVLSNTVVPHAYHNRTHGLFDAFDTVVLSCEVGLVKPDLPIYELVLERLGLEGSECVFVDDRAENLPSAEKLGMGTVLYHSFPDLEANLGKLHVKA